MAMSGNFSSISVTDCPRFITGTATIASFGASAPTDNTPIYFVTFTSTPVLGPNSSTFNLPGLGYIGVVAGDSLIAQYSGSGVWTVLAYFRKSGRVLSDSTLGGTFTAAATVDLGTDFYKTQSITGTTTITSFGASAPAGWVYNLLFESATPITYNSASMILPGGQSIITAAGDSARVISLGSGNWKMLSYTSQTGLSGSLDQQFSSTQGAILYRGVSGWQALAPGSAGLFLETNGAGANPAWASPTVAGLSTMFDAQFGSTIGDILYRGTSGWQTLAAGTSGQVLETQGAGAAPQWITSAAGAGVTSVSGSGPGISVSPVTGSVVVRNTGVALVVAGTGISVSTASGTATISGTGVATIVPGAGVQVSTVNGTATIGNSGVRAITASGGIGISANTGTVALTNTGVTSLVAGTGVTISGATGGVTVSATSASNLSALMDAQFGSTVSSILYRGTSGWQVLPPPTAGSLDYGAYLFISQANAISWSPLSSAADSGGGGG